jgi:hypothetical protein
MFTVLIIIVAASAVAAVFGLAALRFGTDSRPGFDGRPERERFGALL